MILESVKGESQIITQDPVAPITDPSGARPSGLSLAPGNAAIAAGGSESPLTAVLGVSDGNPKNIIFIGLVLFLVWKFRKGILA